MVFVKVRETYDLHTLPNKMSLIAVHTPNAAIVRRNYPGLLMQTKAWRPVACDVKMACASMLPLDPLGVGTGVDDVAPEDVFNPILYKAVSNFSMSQIERLVHRLGTTGEWTARGDSLDSSNDGLTTDDFNIYYGLLSDTHGWKHANPQSGLTMSGLRPLVYEKVYTVNDDGINQANDGYAKGTPSASNAPIILPDGTRESATNEYAFKGSAKPMPWLPTLVPIVNNNSIPHHETGFTNVVSAVSGGSPDNYYSATISPRIYCGLICVPPSRRHQLFYRLVCEWTLEFSSIRSIIEITNFAGVASIGNLQHVMDYDFSDSKLVTEDTDLVSTSDDSGIHKVM